jgi:hypothetical protein
MIIADIAIKSIHGNTQAKTRLAQSLKASIHTVERWIKDNLENGPLTRILAVEIISEETGIEFHKVTEKTNVATAIET